MTNEHCSPHHYDGDGDDEHDRHESTFEKASQLSGTSNTNRFCTFTKCKIKQQPSTVIANPYQRRYFDSPTMIVLDDDDDEIPIVRCSNRSLAAAAAAGGHEPSLNETDLSDLLVFTNPNRVLSESMRVVISRHPSLQDMKYVNDVSSVLVAPLLLAEDDEEHVYQELIRCDLGVTTPTAELRDSTDDDKENRPPLMPIRSHVSRIPVWTSSTHKRNAGTPMMANLTAKDTDMKRKKPTVTATSKPSLADLLNEWSHLSPKLKELLSNTGKMPLRVPDLSPQTADFRRLKQLLTDLEVTTASWTNAINQCRYVLQHAQQQSCR